MRYIKLFEEFTISELDKSSLDIIKSNLLFKLREYNQSILQNLNDYKIDSIITRSMLNEMNNEFTTEFIKEINFEKFLNDLIEPIKSKNRRDIINIFKEYVNYIKNL